MTAFGSAGIVVALLCGALGCHSRYAADEPVKMAPEACCRLADEGMKKFMEDPRVKDMKMPFDGQRMIFGGFRVLVNA